MKTRVYFLLDRTYSMLKRKRETMEAFNGYLDDLAKDPNIEFTLTTFDTLGMDKICVNVPIADAPRLTNDNYIPRDNTNLRESIIKFVEAIAELDAPADQYRPPLVVVQSDGEENASKREYTRERARALKSSKEEQGWQFLFMGCDFDNYDLGAEMGFSAAQTMSHSGDAASTDAAYRVTASVSRSYASTGATAEFSAAGKLAAGDKYASKVKPGVSGPVKRPATAQRQTKVTPNKHFTLKEEDKFSLKT